MQSEPPTPNDSPGLSSWYVLSLLFAVYVMNIADRQIVGILAEDIKRDLMLSDSEIGFLTGPAIAFFYAILGLPLAHAADRTNRVRFIALCLAIWSAVTIFGGRTSNFVQLALTRVGVSIAEAGGTPASVSLIGDYFPPTRRALAMAVWTSGTTVGVFVGFALGGVINQHLGWRNCFLIAGIPGILLALLLLATVREPIRGARDGEPAPLAGVPTLSLWRSISVLWRIPLYRRAVMASVFGNFCMVAVLAWGPAFAVRTYGVGTAQVGQIMGLGIAIAGGGTLILAGLLSDIMGRRGLAWPLCAVALALLTAAVFFVLAFNASDFTRFSIFLLIAYAAVLTYPPIVWVIVQTAAPARMRAMSTAVMLMAVALGAGVPAPLLVGMASDALAGVVGANSLRLALMIVPCVSVLAAIQFLRTAQTARRASAGNGDNTPAHAAFDSRA